MNLKLTARAKKAFENAIHSAKLNLNCVAEPEHFLRSILDEESILNKYLNEKVITDVKNKLNHSILSFPKVSGNYEVSLSPQMANLFKEAESKAKDHISVPLLVLLLLKIKKIGQLFDKVDDLIEKLSKEVSSTNYDTENSDDATDKMSQFAVEVVSLARQNKLDPVAGREDEIRQIIEILAKKTKSNVIMVGKPGVGKTAIINGIAQQIANGECSVLEGFKIYNVDIGAMVAGAAYRGQFEERLKGLIKEAESDRKTILFIDEIHIVLGAGKSDGSLDAANILKPALADGSLKVIGATTYDEFRKYVTKDPAFERRFVKVNIKEPSIEDTVTILRRLRERIESHHGVKISDKALNYAASVGKKYIPNRRLPDLAIDLIDTACSSAIINLSSEPIEIQQLKNKIWSLELEKTSIEIDLQRDPSVIENLRQVERKIEEVKNELKPLEDSYNIEKANIIQARSIKKKLEEAKNRMEQAKRENDRYAVFDLQNNIIPVYEKQLEQFSTVEVIQPVHVAEVLSRISGIPISRLTVKENEKLISLAARLKSKIFGQDSAVDTVVNSILASKVGLNRENKPIGSFLFLGPTGVGKTELSKLICEELNDTSENMVILDMSDYVSEISINKLIGAPAGYVGCDDGGSLTEPIKEMPYNVVLLDEVDLAHQSNLNVLYQLLDEGRVTDGRGVKVSFKNTVVIMTSNLGQEYIKPGEIDRKKIEEKVIQRFGQPLINRIDNLVIFDHLDADSLHKIFQKDLAELNKKLIEKKLRFSVSDEVVRYAIESCLNSNYGARIIKRFIKDHFINPITKILLSTSRDRSLDIHCFLNTENVMGEVYGDFTFVLN